MLASVESFSGDPAVSSPPITVRLIGILDGVLVEHATAAFAGLAAPGPQTFVIRMRDALLASDDHLDRFVAALRGFEADGHRIVIDAPPLWRKLAAQRGGRFVNATAADGKLGRRQVIICHSADKRGATV